MTASTTLVGIGKQALHASRKTLAQRMGETAPDCLQQIGYASGPELFEHFAGWLREEAGVARPADLDADGLADVVAGFFESTGWGTLRVERTGPRGLTLTSSDWAESEPGAGEEYPSCFLSAGMLADFLTRLAGGETVAIMEVECRSRGDARCRFFAGAPPTLEAVYAALSEGRDYETVFAS